MHYTLVRNLSRLITSRTKHNGRQYIRRYCLHPFSTEERLTKHRGACSKHSPARIIMPTSHISPRKDENPKTIQTDYDMCVQPTVDEDIHADVRSAEDTLAAQNPDDPSKVPTNRLSFKAIHCQFPVSWVIYADFEAIVDERGQHIPSGFCCLTVLEFEICKPVCYSGPETMPRFFDHITAERNRICQLLERNVPMNELTSEEEERYRTSSNCECCDEAYTDTNLKCRHHCH